MKRRTDFVTNSSSMSWLMALLFGIPIGLGAGVGHVCAHVGHQSSQAAASAGGAAVTPTAPAPAAPAPDAGAPRGDVAWGGDSYILTGQDAIDWLTERGLVSGGKFTNRFWDEWYLPPVSDDRPPIDGLRGMGGDWKFERGSGPGFISIVVEDPTERRPSGPAPAPKPASDAGAGTGEPEAGQAATPATSDTTDGAPEPESPEPVKEPTGPVSEQKPGTTAPVKTADKAAEAPAAPPSQPGTAKTDDGKPTPPPPPPWTNPGDAIRYLLTSNLKDPNRLKGVTAEWQFTVNGSQGGTYTVSIRDQQVTVSERAAANPNVAIAVPDQLLRRVYEGTVTKDDVADAVLELQVEKQDGSIVKTVEALGFELGITQKIAIETKILADATLND